jgi:hypothetical protein
MCGGKFCYTNIVENGTKGILDILHKCGEMLLKNTDDKVRPDIFRLTGTQLGSDLGPTWICCERDE